MEIGAIRLINSPAITRHRKKTSVRCERERERGKRKNAENIVAHLLL
jgi:hypothetical protein